MNTLKPGFTDPLFELWAQRTLLTLAEGASGHCVTLARPVYHQRAFDRLDEIFQTSSAS